MEKTTISVSNKLKKVKIFLLGIFANFDKQIDRGSGMHWSYLRHQAVRSWESGCAAM